MSLLEISEILDSIDIVEFLSQYVELNQRGDEFWGLSPFKEEKTPSFSVRKEEGKFYCFASGIGGNAVTFLRYYLNISSHEAVEIIKKYAGISDGDYTPRSRIPAVSVCKRFAKPKTVKKETTNNLLPDNYMERFEDKPERYEMWRREGISDEAMKFFGVRYDAFSNCIVYPIRNSEGQITNVGGRTLDPSFKEKGIRKYTYFKPWGGQMNIVYGLFENYQDILSKKEIVLFEGMKSVLIARGYGLKNTGAILTSHLNPGQMKVLLGLGKFGVRVVFALDKDVNIRQDKNINTLRKYINVSYLCDTKNKLDEKDSPVDKGKEVFYSLYDQQIRFDVN